MVDKYQELTASECETLIKDKCDRIKNFPLNPFKPSQEHEPRMAMVQELIRLLNRKNSVPHI